jgi:hypothetical protein
MQKNSQNACSNRKYGSSNYDQNALFEPQNCEKDPEGGTELVICIVRSSASIQGSCSKVVN